MSERIQSFTESTLTSKLAEKVKRVWVLGEIDSIAVRRVLAGVTRYRHEQGVSWLVQLAGFEALESDLSWLSSRRGDGIIVCDCPDVFVPVLHSIGVPAVCVGGSEAKSMLPTFLPDTRGVAALAAQHFIERGFRGFIHFSYRDGDCPSDRIRFSVHELSRMGTTCCPYLFPVRREKGGGIPGSAIRNWLRKITPPVAIWACDDELGLSIVNACTLEGFSVPDEVAVLGVNDDSWVCESASPGLSSIRLDVEGAAHRAASLLAKLMNGERQTHGLITSVPPIGISIRGSTNVKSVEDRQVARALQIIREEACAGLQISELTRRVPIARRLLEQRFKSVVGWTLRDEVWRVQFSRAKELLEGTELSAQQVSERCGFKHVEYFRTAFKRYTGLTPGKWRVTKSGK